VLSAVRRQLGVRKGGGGGGPCEVLFEGRCGVVGLVEVGWLRPVCCWTAAAAVAGRQQQQQQQAVQQASKSFN
jgi:hypothetical protein